MRRLRTLSTMLLGLLLLLDGVIAFRIWWYGTKYVSMTDGRLSVESVPFTGMDWLILLLLVGVHAALIYAVWKAWRSAPVRV
jgi:multisubunit Na+/H+ antiporter MnhB subunit